MDDIKRYSIYTSDLYVGGQPAREDKNGLWVLFAHHAARVAELQARIEALKKVRVALGGLLDQTVATFGASTYDVAVNKARIALGDTALLGQEIDTALLVRAVEQPAETCGKQYATSFDAQTGERLGIAWCQKEPGHPPSCGPKG